MRARALHLLTSSNTLPTFAVTRSSGMAESISLSVAIALRTNFVSGRSGYWPGVVVARCAHGGSSWRSGCTARTSHRRKKGGLDWDCVCVYAQTPTRTVNAIVLGTSLQQRPGSAREAHSLVERGTRVALPVSTAKRGVSPLCM